MSSAASADVRSKRRGRGPDLRIMPRYDSCRRSAPRGRRASNRQLTRAVTNRILFANAPMRCCVSSVAAADVQSKTCWIAHDSKGWCSLPDLTNDVGLSRLNAFDAFTEGQGDRAYRDRRKTPKVRCVDIHGLSEGRRADDIDPRILEALSTPPPQNLLKRHSPY